MNEQILLTIQLLARAADGRTFGIYAEGAKVNVEQDLDRDDYEIREMKVSGSPRVVSTTFTLRMGPYVWFEPDAAEIQPPEGFTR